MQRAGRWLLCMCAIAVRSADESAAEAPACALKPLEDPKPLFALIDAHLKAPHAAELKGLCEAPCDAVKQGLVMNRFKQRTTNAELGAFQLAALKELEPAAVAAFWELVPEEPQTWLLKSFVASLRCTVRKGSTACAEAATNDALERFEKARASFARRALAARGMEPFPVSDGGTAIEKADGVAGVKQYAAKLGIEGDAVEWLAAQFAPSAADRLANPNVTLVEPTWFRTVGASCRQQAYRHTPGAKPELDSAEDLSSLVTAVNVQLWAWYYKTCHKNSVIYAFEHRDDVAAALADDAAAAEGAERARGGEL